jgi:hypothetical protein
LEFLPLYPSETLLPFIETLDLQDNISVVDYVVHSKHTTSEFILVIRTNRGSLALYNSGSKKLYSKQYHEGMVH